MKFSFKEIVKQINEEIEKFNARENGLDRNTIMNGVTVYHRPKDGYVDVGTEKHVPIVYSLFKYGFSREFTGSNGGNMYGAGVYTVYTLKSSNEKARGYGSAIIKAKLIGGYQDFLIFSKNLAQQTYGDRWEIHQQIQDLFPEGDAKRILKSIKLFMHNENSQHVERTADPAHNITLLLRETGMNRSKIRGIVYNGGHDGACCFVRDFSSVIPVAVSYDNGKTWEYKLSDALIKRYSEEVDTHFQFGSNTQFQDIALKSVNGFTAVWNKQGKINYIPANSNTPISKIWFDEGQQWENKNGFKYVTVKIDGYTLQIALEDGKYMLYDNGQPLDATLDELPELLKAQS